VRAGLRCVLDGPEFETIEAANGISALLIALEQPVDLVLLDVELPDLDGLEVLRRIKLQRPELPVLMHSCHDLIAFVERSMQLGAAGFLIKSPNSSDLVAAVRIAATGGSVWTDAQIQYATHGEDARRPL
jgi:DNA-binding NarL/FixJ family response regulator